MLGIPDISLEIALKLKISKIIKERLNTLITNDGFLREGSSHYHFLFTSSILKAHFSLSQDKATDQINKIIQ